MCRVMLVGAGGSQTLAFQLTTTFTSAGLPPSSIVGSTLLIVCTSSKKRRVTFSYQTVNSVWPWVGSSGHSMSLPSSVIIASSSSTGAWTSSALYHRSARSTISSLVSGSLNSASFRKSESFCPLRSRVRPRPGDRAAVGRVLVVVGHFLVQQQVDQERTVLGECLLDREPHLVGGLDARRRHAHALGELVEPDHGVAEVERARERVILEAPLLPVLLHVQLEQLVAAVVADDELRADPVPRGRPHGLDRVHRAAVAAEADHGLVGHRELDAQGAREADAERAAAC